MNSQITVSQFKCVYLIDSIAPFCCNSLAHLLQYLFKVFLLASICFNLLQLAHPIASAIASTCSNFLQLVRPLASTGASPCFNSPQLAPTCSNLLQLASICPPKMLEQSIQGASTRLRLLQLAPIRLNVPAALIQ